MAVHIYEKGRLIEKQFFTTSPEAYAFSFEMRGVGFKTLVLPK